MSRALPWLAVALGSLAFAVTTASIVFLTLTWDTPRPEAAALPSYGVEVAERLQFLAVAVIGAYIAARRPRHPIGWLMVLGALGFPLQNFAEAYARYALEAAPGALPGGPLAAWGTNWLWALTYPLPALLFLLFPTGRPVSPRWRVLIWAAGLLGALAVLSTALLPGPLHDFPDRQNPAGVPGLEGLGETLVVVSISGLMVCFLLGLVSLVVRYHRAGSEERAQLKWLVLAAGLFVLFIAGSVTGAFQALGDMAQTLASVAAGLGLTLAVALAILRYRLYDIDLVISRTVSYALLTALLAGVYASSVVLLGRLLAPLRAESDLAVAVATLAAAVMFAPARRRIQTGVDRRFNRTRYDARQELDAFRARLRDDVDLDDVRRHLVHATWRTVAPMQVSVWIAARLADEGAGR